MNRVTFSILCGGSGSRLWPKSREKLPKQLLRLTNQYSMLQNTVLRVSKFKEFIPNVAIQIICNQDHGFIIQDQLKEIDQHHVNIIMEPKGRDSAAAVCISALLHNPDEYTFIIPCDHIFDDYIFLECCMQAMPFLESSIVTFGITPTRAETGYGYIKTSGLVTDKFVEKPDKNLAQIYLDSGLYYWNAGVFGFKNGNMIRCFEKYSDDILTVCRKTLENSDRSSNFMLLSSDPFLTCKAISVDYAIMEPIITNKFIYAVTIPYTSSWNDIGSYSALYDEMPKDVNMNVVQGDVININSKNCYIESADNQMIATVGLENTIVIGTRDAVLVCNKDVSQDVKKIVDQLKKDGREEYVLHKKVFRPWGWYINIEGTDYSGFKVKHIAVYPKKRLSLQSHNKRSEHWVIVKGNARVQLNDDLFDLHADQNIYIPVLSLHRIENIGDELLEFTETQIGSYLGEDDIIRYQDDFGRN